MRITELEHQAIKQAVESFDPRAEIYLFGSRADPHKKGGDIDLLVLSSIITKQDIRKIRWKICDQIGEQKIDIIVGRDNSEAFVRIALSQGIKL